MIDDERTKDIARGIALEKRAQSAETGVGVVVCLVVIVAVLILGSAYTNWGGWVALWALGLGAAAGTWASRGIKAGMLR